MSAKGQKMPQLYRTQVLVGSRVMQDREGRVMGKPTVDIFAFCGKPLLACTFCIHGALFMRGPFCVHAVCTLCVLMNTNRCYPKGTVTPVSRFRFNAQDNQRLMSYLSVFLSASC